LDTDLTIDQYIDGLEHDRQELVQHLRSIVNESIDPNFKEIIDFGMIAWVVPLEREPDTYNGHPLMYAALASQKRYVSLYLMGIYADSGVAEWFKSEYEATGRKPNMGKSCVRFRKLEDVPEDLIASAVKRYTVDSYLSVASASRRRS
jgi:hypothetical protein